MKIYLLKAKGEPWSWRQWGLNTQWVDSGSVFEAPSGLRVQAFPWWTLWDGPVVHGALIAGHRTDLKRRTWVELCFPTVYAALWPWDEGSSIITTPLSSRQSRVVTFFSLVFFAAQSWLVTWPRWKPCLPGLFFPPWLHEEGTDGCLDLSSGYPGPRMSGSAQSPKQEEVPVEVSETLVLRVAVSSRFPGCPRGMFQEWPRGCEAVETLGAALEGSSPSVGFTVSPAGDFQAEGQLPAPRRSRQRVPSACRAWEVCWGHFCDGHA